MSCKCLLGAMRQIIHLSDQYIAKRLKEENLPILSAHIPLFYILPQNGDGMYFNELCAQWNKSKSSLSDMIAKYVESGLVRRCECAADKRNVYISLTPEAIDVRKTLDKISSEISSILFSGDSENDIAIFENKVEDMLKKGKEIL